MNKRIVHLGAGLAALALLVIVPAAFAFERRTARRSAPKRRARR